MATMAITNSGFPSIRLSRLENIISPRTAQPIPTISQPFKFPWSEDASFLKTSDWSTTNTRS